VFKATNGKPFVYQKFAIAERLLRALPTPTTFEKVDQTFIFGQTVLR
jgi:hypothetical protein